MKSFFFLFTSSFLCLSCQNNYKWAEPKIDNEDIVTFKVIKIDSVEHAYLIEGTFKNNQNIVLVSEKKKSSKCVNRFEIGKTYTMKLNFESFAAGDYYGYNLFGKEYPLETAISLDDKKLNGLCLK